MANVKISALTAASVANSADEVAMVQAGVTKRATMTHVRTGLAASGANSDVTSLSGLTTALTVGQGGTGAGSASGARSNLGLGSTATISLSGSAADSLKGDGTWSAAGGGSGISRSTSLALASLRG